MPPPDFWSALEPEIPWLHKQLRRLQVRERDLDDVAQDVLVSVYKAWDRYDTSRALRPWLFGFAFRVASEYRRRRDYRLPPSTLDGEPLDDAESIEDVVGDEQLRRLAIAALGHMPEERRATFVMMELEGFTAQEVSEALDVPVNTVYSRLRKAREEFGDIAARLRERGGTHE